MRIFKKKDGSPSGFAKVLKGVGKVAAKVLPAAASVIPVPGSGALSKILGSVGGKIGVASLAAAAPSQSESIADYANRVMKGAGGALAGFTEQVQTAPELSADPSSPIQVKQSLTQGFAQNKYGKYMLFAALGVGGFFLLKTFRIIK